MANKHEHADLGAILGAIIPIADVLPMRRVMQGQLTETHLSYNKTLLDIVESSLVGRFSAALADMLEPANNPHHRGFWHSKSLLILLLGTVVKIDSWNLTPRAKRLLLVCLLAYISHLALDSRTPYGLP